jgi:hypothetical protein
LVSYLMAMNQLRTQSVGAWTMILSRNGIQ